jgi:hypothetical protein
VLLRLPRLLPACRRLPSAAAAVALLLLLLNLRARAALRGGAA